MITDVDYVYNPSASKVESYTSNGLNQYTDVTIRYLFKGVLLSASRKRPVASHKSRLAPRVFWYLFYRA
ncbi:MAG: hypothetical protein IIA70_04720 [Proteobacteria bacterium]|nr:hypothetical protein [Pseudomonadota bacterium]